MATEIPPMPIPQPLPVGPVYPQPQPATVQIPSWVIPVVNMISWFLGWPWLRTAVAILGASFGANYVLEQKLPAMIDRHVPAPIKRLIPPPKKVEDAIGQVFFGNSMCTATIIGEVWTTDESLDVLTAAHCVQLGAKGTMKLKDGRVIAVKCVARDGVADCAWLRAANPGGDIPYMILASELPAAGDAVWHQGYGRDKPGNRETGKFKGVTSNGKQCNYLLSVSPGDSGGAIVLDRLGHVLGPVCCTTKISQLGDMWGATPEACAAIRPTCETTADEPPLIYPVLPIPEWEFDAANQS